MSKFFYPKLAASNIKKHARLYVPYLITCIGTVMMYYIITALSRNESLAASYGGPQVQAFLEFGCWIIGIFAVIFLFYTNGFLIKQRKKEFGLFNILGMEKRHISRIILIETLYTAAVSLILGLVFGILFSRLVELFLYQVLHFDVAMGIEIVPSAIGSTLLLFGVIFFLILLNSLRQIHLSDPIQLLRGGNVGEKEPKAKWLLALIGFLCLGGGYYISLTTQSPMEAVFLFFVAIVLVMIGTYCLFTAGSIAVLKLLKKKKGFYYRTKHFIGISGMMYRMKQNAVGLANICILCTGVLIMLSTTFSLYTGMEDLIRNRYPRDVQISGSAMTDEDAARIDAAVSEVTEENDMEPVNTVWYRYMGLTLFREGSSFYTEGEAEGMFGNNVASIVCIPLEDFNRQKNGSETLAEDQVLLYEANGKLEGNRILIDGQEFRIKRRLDSLFLPPDIMDALTDSFYLIVPDRETVLKMVAENKEALKEAANFGCYYGFDTEEEEGVQTAVVNEIGKRLGDQKVPCYVEGEENSRESFYSLYGSMLFLGIFLGLLFVMATVLIIYYKQISEGYEDKERFHIMQKVGMSRREVKAAIHSQVLAVFFLPLLTACVHTAFAYPVVKKIMVLMNLTNTVIFIQTSLVTVAAFAVFYVMIYSLTAKVYYRIVSA